jgi:hypothetical protein
MNCGKNAAKKIISLGLEIPPQNPYSKPPSNYFNCDGDSSIFVKLCDPLLLAFTYDQHRDWSRGHNHNNDSYAVQQVFCNIHISNSLKITFNFFKISNKNDVLNLLPSSVINYG